MITPRLQIINLINIDTIVDKINKFVWYYAKEKNISQWVYSIQFEFLYQIDIFPDNTPVYKNMMCELYQIDCEREFYSANFDYVYSNSPFNKNKPPMKEIINAFIRMYHEEYIQIDEFINKMLYSIPSALEEDDFIKLNELYSKIKTDGISNDKQMSQGLI